MVDSRFSTLDFLWHEESYVGRKVVKSYHPRSLRLRSVRLSDERLVPG